MKIWEVGVSDCESCATYCLCSTKEIAERELFKIRDKLLVDWGEMHEYQVKSIKEYCEKEKVKIWKDDLYSKMIKNLSGNDYGDWKNYPHDVPWIKETTVKDK